MLDSSSNLDEMIGVSKALGKAVREIRAAWLEPYGTEMIVGGASARLTTSSCNCVKDGPKTTTGIA